MKKKICIRVLAIVLALSLVGCGSSVENNVQPTTSGSSNVSQSESGQDTEEISDTTEPEEENREVEKEARLKAEEAKKLTEQQNSFSMMYYLAITAEEIRTSKDNRLILEDIYTSLLNDINPGAVDEITQDHLKNLLLYPVSF